jgi:uncharacterized membrane protein
MKQEMVMDRMLVVVFDNESKAYEAQKALLELDSEGSVSVYSYAVLAKNADGTATIKNSDDTGPLETLAATSLGALIGVLGGPVGMVVGGAAGALSGATVDVVKARVGNDFINDVSKVLLPNRVALVAEVEEEWITPVDTRMEKLGGTVLRRAVSDVRDEQDAEYMAAMKADYDQLKAEHAKAQADRKAKLTEKINQLDSKIQHRLQENKERRETLKREAQAKAEVLKAKASSSRLRAS